jgi:hypothetical protein
MAERDAYSTVNCQNCMQERIAFTSMSSKICDTIVNATPIGAIAPKLEVAANARHIWRVISNAVLIEAGELAYGT